MSLRKIIQSHLEWVEAELHFQASLQSDLGFFSHFLRRSTIQHHKFLVITNEYEAGYLTDCVYMT